MDGSSGIDVKSASKRSVAPGGALIVALEFVMNAVCWSALGVVWSAQEKGTQLM